MKLTREEGNTVRSLSVPVKQVNWLFRRLQEVTLVLYLLHLVVFLFLI